MSKEAKAKDKENTKQSQQDDTKLEKNKEPITKMMNSKRNTRTSNVKEEGFYKFHSMMTRNVSSQIKESPQKITKRAKKRVKRERS